MRIISGKFSGQRLKGEVAAATRPTSDRVREALASALAARDAFADAHVLDLFAGTGALGFEALSRGAAHVVAVDNDTKALRAIEANARQLAVGAQFAAHKLDLFKDPSVIASRLAELSVAPYSLVFADPPYAKAQQALDLVALLASHHACSADALFVVEHASKGPLAIAETVRITGEYRYGDTSVTLLARAR